MRKQSTKQPLIVLPSAYNIGDEVAFKYEGNLRAIVEGVEVGSKGTRIVTYTVCQFNIPLSQIVSVERDKWKQTPEGWEPNS